MGTTFATLRSLLGVAKEATKGTAVAPTAFIPVTKFDPSPKQLKLDDGGWRGSMGDLYGMQNGPRSADLDMSGPVFVDTIGFLLAGILGDVTTTGASSPYTHAMALKNGGDGQPGAYTFTDNAAGIQGRAYSGAQITDLTLKFDVTGLMTYDAKATAWIGAPATQPTPTFGNTIPIPSWLCALTLGGASVANVQSMEIAIKRANVEAAFGLGSQDPYSIAVGGLQVTGKMSLIAKDESPYLAYANNSGPGAVVATFSQGANASLALQMSQVQYDDAKVTRGKSFITWETTFKAILNSTDVGTSAGLGPIKATLIDALPSGTFA